MGLRKYYQEHNGNHIKNIIGVSIAVSIGVVYLVVSFIMDKYNLVPKN